MAEMVYVTARRKAADLLRENWDGRLPVRLTEITSNLGASKYEADLGPVLSGIVSKEQNASPVIVVHSRHSPERRRFTWAHELGHIVERAALAEDDDYSFTDGRGVKYDLHEFFADEFAGSLLMPEEEISRMRRNGYTHGQMAVEFGVSVDALTKRLGRLAKHPDHSSFVA
ncbi:ImmA/IrrE family metallo-endopeptidase [Leucobacter musarum]|uniref:ImmA/IrrE family metallo-endopeptidase n=1 Tax=Leucobacter musarum TaxID=1930747 RepID=UPI000B0E6A49|nr:ImmA/IrrE family metallo-endopeptidase [Leucobacter musarum]